MYLCFAYVMMTEKDRRVNLLISKSCKTMLTNNLDDIISLEVLIDFQAILV